MPSRKHSLWHCWKKRAAATRALARRGQLITPNLCGLGQREMPEVRRSKHIGEGEPAAGDLTDLCIKVTCACEAEGLAGDAAAAFDQKSAMQINMSGGGTDH